MWSIKLNARSGRSKCGNNHAPETREVSRELTSEWSERSEDVGPSRGKGSEMGVRWSKDHKRGGRREATPQYKCSAIIQYAC